MPNFSPMKVIPGVAGVFTLALVAVNLGFLPAAIFSMVTLYAGLMFSPGNIVDHYPDHLWRGLVGFAIVGLWLHYAGLQVINLIVTGRVLSPVAFSGRLSAIYFDPATGHGHWAGSPTIFEA